MKKIIEIIDEIKKLFSVKHKIKQYEHFSKLIDEGDLEKFKNEFENISKQPRITTTNILFREACYKNQVDIVDYMLTSPKAKIFHNMPFYKTQWLEESCKIGSMDVIKYIVTNPLIKNNKDFPNIINEGLYYSCLEGDLELIKFFTSDSLIKYTRELESKFLTFLSGNFKKTEIVQYFIFDLNIKMNDDIREHFYQLKSWDKVRPDVIEAIDMFEKMFEKRDVKEELVNELYNQSPKKSKINKI